MRSEWQFIGVYLKVLTIYWKGFFGLIAGRNSKAVTAYQNMHRAHSFRLSKDTSNMASPIRYLVSTLKKLTHPAANAAYSNVTLIVSKERQVQPLSEYLNEIGVEDGFNVLCWTHGGANLRFGFFFTLPFILLVFVETLIYSIFLPKYRDAASLSQLAMIECAINVWRIRQGTKQVYLIGAFENHASLFACACASIGVRTAYIASATSLSRYYQKVVCDKLILTAPFHLEQQKQLEKNWFVEETVLCPPMNFKLLNESVVAENDRQINYDIGLISSGIWRRKERGDIYQNNGTRESEEKLFDLAVLWPSHFRVIILLHPCEMETKEIYERASKVHRAQFGDQVQLSAYGVNSYSYYSQINTCVAAYSSATLDRIYMGYKMLLTPFYLLNNPYRSISLNSICIYEPDLIDQEVRRCLQVSDRDYFKEYGLLAYQDESWRKL